MQNTFFMDGERYYGSAYSGEEHYANQGIHDENGAPENDYMEREFDLNEQLIKNKTATYFFRMNGDSMQGAGIFNGDTLIVDRSAKALSGKVVVAVLNGELLVRRLEKTFNKVRLIPETSRLSPIDVDPSGAEFSIWGIVTYVIHAV